MNSIYTFVEFLRQLEERIATLEAQYEKTRAPILQEQSELGAKESTQERFSEEKPSEQEQAPAQNQPVVHTTPEPTPEDRLALVERVSKLIAPGVKNGPELSQELRLGIKSGSLPRATALTTWNEYDSLDYWLTSKGF